MKKLYVLILICFCSFFIKAQYTITAASNPAVGDIESYMFLDTTGLFLGSSGLSQTWNYSAVTTMTYPPSSNTYVAMSSVPNNFLFPGATIASDDGFSNYNVFSNTATKNELLGYATTTTSNCILFSNPIKFYNIPFSYGSSSPDTYGYSLPSYTASGTFTTTGDGTGTLQLPIGNYNNVLKLKFSIYGMDNSGTTASSYTATECRYYSALSKFPLLIVGSQTTIVTSTTVTTYFNKYGQINSIVIADITSNKKGIDFNVFPNPVSNGELFITNSNPLLENMKIEISTILGQNLRTITLENTSATETKKIDVSDLPKGIYYLQIKNKETTKTQKIIIE